MINRNGYRLNVGIIIYNIKGQVLWAKRTDQYFWQFPQGGIKIYETPKMAMYRELFEEVGLTQQDVHIDYESNNWIQYTFPKKLIRWKTKPLCIGQKQKWYLVRLLCSDEFINIKNNKTSKFDYWKWVSYWYPIRQIVPFKRYVYRQIMKEFSKKLFICSKSKYLKF
ncbi:RNA pyrophosphohydrolase [Candidatus Erwinia haradaeae]|uniref:RNA pyrophosphohydrolase n=1 Tax=Candidatus Erwinia haradaeae TaxID=1922217 RepID=A0A451D3W0_9GAMM|nr:RNA pyrophosphohydrolase [Candidatus Erwinia haradaeae]VFP80345.1 RNA pyrophosphohydrolase [Candidatus Erwinia haradaeae]